MEIAIRDLPVTVKLGYFPKERAELQQVLVTVLAEIPDEFGNGDPDDIDLTVDYADIVEVIDDAVENKEILLIESVVEKIGTALLRRFSKIRSVSVETQKIKIPGDVTRGAKVSVKKTFRRLVKVQ
jgi:FolB domain-containing protein